jgi:hypothetical protein
MGLSTRREHIQLFTALTIVGVTLVVFRQGAVESAVHTVLSLLGTVIFTAGLTYFLVKLG